MKLENLQKVHSALCKSSPHCNITNDEWKGDAWIAQRQEAIKIVQDEIIAASPKGEVIISKIGEHL